MLTTFNEVDLSKVSAARKELQDEFVKAHGIKLGFNAVWNVSDRFKLSFDAHNSKNESRPNDPLTGARALWIGCAPSSERRVYYGNHASHGDFVLIWSSMPPA
ncbi:hypothetical protein ABGA94_05760, partial [Stenotrophomonas sp. 3diitr2024]